MPNRRKSAHKRRQADTRRRRKADRLRRRRAAKRKAEGTTQEADIDLGVTWQ